MAADALSPCLASPSTVMLLIIIRSRRIILFQDEGLCPIIDAKLYNTFLDILYACICMYTDTYFQNNSARKLLKIKDQWGRFSLLFWPQVQMTVVGNTALRWRHNGRDGVSNHQPHIYSDADQRKPQGSTSLAFVWGIHRGPVNSPHKWPVTRKIFPFDDVIMMSQDSIQIFPKYFLKFLQLSPIVMNRIFGSERYFTYFCYLIHCGLNKIAFFRRHFKINFLELNKNVEFWFKFHQCLSTVAQSTTNQYCFG